MSTQRKIIGYKIDTSVVNLWETDQELATVEDIMNTDLPFAVMSFKEVMAKANQENWRKEDVYIFSYED